MADSKRILIVEDDPFISELYVRALKKYGYEVTLCLDGKQGLDEALKGSYDLMLLDIMLPQVTGLEILDKLRGPKPKAPNTKIVITTNLDQDDETRMKVEKLADGYIIKADITPRSLLHIIQKIEEQGQPPTA